MRLHTCWLFASAWLLGCPLFHVSCSAHTHNVTDHDVSERNGEAAAAFYEESSILGTPVTTTEQNGDGGDAFLAVLSPTPVMAASELASGSSPTPSPSPSPVMIEASEIGAEADCEDPLDTLSEDDCNDELDMAESDEDCDDDIGLDMAGDDVGADADEVGANATYDDAKGENGESWGASRHQGKFGRGVTHDGHGHHPHHGHGHQHSNNGHTSQDGNSGGATGGAAGGDGGDDGGDDPDCAFSIAKETATTSSGENSYPSTYDTPPPTTTPVPPPSPTPISYSADAGNDAVGGEGGTRDESGNAASDKDPDCDDKLPYAYDESTSSSLPPMSDAAGCDHELNLPGGEGDATDDHQAADAEDEDGCDDALEVADGGDKHAEHKGHAWGKYRHAGKGRGGHGDDAAYSFSTREPENSGADLNLADESDVVASVLPYPGE